MYSKHSVQLPGTSHRKYVLLFAESRRQLYYLWVNPLDIHDFLSVSEREFDISQGDWNWSASTNRYVLGDHREVRVGGAYNGWWIWVYVASIKLTRG
jgi:hypothetical protein